MALRLKKEQKSKCAAERDIFQLALGAVEDGEQLGLTVDWDSVEKEELELQKKSQMTNDVDAQHRMGLSILECSDSGMATRSIHKHLTRQNKIYERDEEVWSRATISRYLLYKAGEIVALVLSLFVVLYINAECGIVWDDTTRNQTKLMAIHLQSKYCPRKEKKDSLRTFLKIRTLTSLRSLLGMRLLRTERLKVVYAQ